MTVKLLTVTRDLQRRKAREKLGQFVAEGVRTVESLLASSLVVDGLLVSSEARDETRVRSLCEQAAARSIAVREVTTAEFASAADTEAPQGVLAVAHIPRHTLSAPGTMPVRYLVLDALQDPGNVGTVVRTAAALGVTATICLPGTVDCWNAKVVRSAMGALFEHPIVALDWGATQAFFTEHQVDCWAADLDGVPLDALDRGALARRLALIVSNEGAGLSPALEAAVGQRVAIAMAPGTESLNVAVATGILLHALRPATGRDGPVA